MHVNLWIIILVLFLTTQTPGIKADSDEDEVKTNDQQFIVDEHKETRELVKSELYFLFENMADSFNQKLAAIESKIEKSFSKLTESIHEIREKVEKSEQKLENSISSLSTCNSVHHKLTTIGSKLEKSFLNLNESFLEIRQRQMASELKNEMLIYKMSESFNGSLSKILVELGNKIEGNQQNSSCKEMLVSNQGIKTSDLPSAVKTTTATSTSSQPPRIQTVVEELDEDAGTIEFDGKENSHLSRKLWIFGHGRKGYFSSMAFAMEENNLGRSAQLSISEIGVSQHVYTGSQTDWRKERTFSDVVLLVVTLTMGNSSFDAQPPQFKLRFNITRGSNEWVRSTEVMGRDGLQSVSYPPHNNQNYPLKNENIFVMAPPRGNAFRLTLKYLDIPGSPPDCRGTYFKIWLLQESPTEAKFAEVPEFSRCGRRGNISEFIGHTTVAIIRFLPWSSTYETGRGFRLEVDNST